jgi:hypothetical protein
MCWRRRDLRVVPSKISNITLGCLEEYHKSSRYSLLIPYLVVRRIIARAQPFHSYLFSPSVQTLLFERMHRRSTSPWCLPDLHHR